MGKIKSIFVCQQCGEQSLKWQGQCIECKAWNSYQEQAAVKSPQLYNAHQGYAGVMDGVMSLSAIKNDVTVKQASGIAEFDRVLGGGLVAGSAILIGGDPGIGKSTLILQTVCQLSRDLPALYITGEESLQQIHMRAERLQLEKSPLKLMAQTHLESILQQISLLDPAPKVIVIDSIQTMYTDMISSAPGGISQLRETTAKLVQFAKRTQTTLFLIGHVTKEGTLAGPRVLEHMVDTVLYFEGDGSQRLRLLRTVKNRFGAVNELGVFAMSEQGLKEVSNPSAIFLSRNNTQAPGSCILSTWEGSRPLLVEVQALVDECHGNNPKRVSIGQDGHRIAMLLAVLHRHAGIVTYDQDVFVNIVGGVRIHETASDLPTLFAIYSSLANRQLPKELLAFAEVGLSGELRPVPNGPERLSEAAKHGFKRAIVSTGNKPKTSIESLEVVACAHLSEAIAQLSM